MIWGMNHNTEMHYVSLLTSNVFLNVIGAIDKLIELLYQWRGQTISTAQSKIIKLQEWGEREQNALHVGQENNLEHGIFLQIANPLKAKRLHNLFSKQTQSLFKTRS